MKLSLVSVFLAGGMLWGQSAGLQFEAASVRPTVFPNDAFAAGFRMGASSNPCGGGKLTVSGTRVSLSGAAICDIIRLAYDLKSYQVIGIPPSLGYSGQDRNESKHTSVQEAIAGIASQLTSFTTSTHERRERILLMRNMFGRCCALCWLSVSN